MGGLYAWAGKVFAKFGVWLAAIGAVAAAVFMFWRTAKTSGAVEAKEEAAEDRIEDAHNAAAVEVQQARDVAAVVTSTSKATSDVQAEILRTDPDSVDRRLLDEWTRD
jgi:hypothetical protein